jgi:hypothetical protein
VLLLLSLRNLSEKVADVCGHAQSLAIAANAGERRCG